MMRQVGEVELKAVQSEQQKERMYSREYDELRAYAVRLGLEAEAEVRAENQAEANAAQEKITSVEREAETDQLVIGHP